MTISQSVVKWLGIFDRILPDILREIMLISAAEPGPAGKRYQRPGYQESSRGQITCD
ncbi:MAG: hypothetical protein ACYS67_04805 [Planctomycetota bacterium]